MGSPGKSESKSKKSDSGATSLADHVCLFLDCQTTGASPASGGNLLEVAWCKGDAAAANSAPEVSSYLIAQPDDQPIPLRIQMLTGITDDDMETAVDAESLFKHLRMSTKTLPAPRLCVIHYARFEKQFLDGLFAQGKHPFEPVCTFEIARRLYPNLPSRGIRALGGFLGIDLEEVKRAPSHVEATRAIWKHLVECLAERDILSLEQLQEFLLSKAVTKRSKLEYPMERLKRLELPNCPGVYRMLSQNGRVLYVGKATSLKSRVNSHFRGRKKKTSKSKELLTQVAEIDVTECGSPLEAALLETDEIKRFDPPYNVSLKQRSRSLLFASGDFLSYSEKQDEIHTLGPFTNPRGIEAMLRLNATINSGIVDPLILFETIPIEDLVEGVELFLERHNIDKEDRMRPRSLVALGLSLYRSARRLMRQMALDRADLDQLDAESPADELKLDQQNSTEEGMQRGLFDEDLVDMEQNPICKNSLPADEFEETVFDEDSDLTPEEIAGRLESLLIGVARTYLVSKEITCLLNSTISFNYRAARRELLIREGRISQIQSAESREAAGWANLGVCDYDRMRVLLTELVKMRSSGKELTIIPALKVLSSW